MLTDAELLHAKILIVDHQPAHVHLLEGVLDDEGYTRVSSTLDSTQVCALHRENSYDLILLDLMMPGLDGFGVLDELREEAHEPFLPVVVLTAQPDHIMRALQSGARDFISKPFDLVEVKIRIRHVLEVRLLYKLLDSLNRDLEKTLLARTAALRESEARYRNLTALAVDWDWELNVHGEFTRASGPISEILGLADLSSTDTLVDRAGGSWDAVGCQFLKDCISARRPFLDFMLHRQNADGSSEHVRLSGEPMLDSGCGFIGYRGVGAQVLSANDL